MGTPNVDITKNYNLVSFSSQSAVSVQNKYPCTPYYYTPFSLQPDFHKAEVPLLSYENNCQYTRFQQKLIFLCQGSNV